MFPALLQLLRQGMNEAVNWEQSDQRLKQVLELRKQLQNQQQQNVSQAPMLMDGNTRRF